MSKILKIEKNIFYKLVGFFVICLFLSLVIYIIIWGTSLSSFTYQKLIFVLIPFFIFIIYILFPKDPLYISFFIVFLLLPIMGVGLPPRRLGLFIFDGIGILLFLVCIYYKLFKPNEFKTFFNSFSVVPLICLLFSFLHTIDIFYSLYIYVRIMFYYFFYIIVMNYLNIYGYEGFKRMNILLLFSLIVISVFIIIEKIWGLKFSFTGVNLNAFKYLDGIYIRRAAGLFQDPQKVAQFIGVFFVYFLTLFVRNFFVSSREKVFVLIVLLLSGISLLFTISRLALVSTIFCSGFVLLCLNKFNFLKKVITICIFIILLFMCFTLYNVKEMLPISIQKRFETIKESMEYRINIWKETWILFEAPSLTGIGIGNYQKFLIKKKPYLKKIKENGGYVPNQPENGYLKILYETGIIGVLGGLYFILGILYFAYVKIFKNKNEKSITITLSTLMGFSVFFSTFLTIYTISDPRNALIPIILFSILSNERL